VKQSPHSLWGNSKRRARRALPPFGLVLCTVQLPHKAIMLVDHILMISSALSDGIVKQFPEQFKAS
jgi:hypothetical protein